MRRSFAEPPNGRARAACLYASASPWRERGERAGRIAGGTPRRCPYPLKRQVEKLRMDVARRPSARMTWRPMRLASASRSLRRLTAAGRMSPRRAMAAVVAHGLRGLSRTRQADATPRVAADRPRTSPSSGHCSSGCRSRPQEAAQAVIDASARERRRPRRRQWLHRFQRRHDGACSATACRSGGGAEWRSADAKLRRTDAECRRSPEPDHAAATPEPRLGDAMRADRGASTAQGERHDRTQGNQQVTSARLQTDRRPRTCGRRTEDGVEANLYPVPARGAGSNG